MNVENDTVEQSISSDELRTKVNKWERYHDMQLKHLNKDDRRIAFYQRNRIAEELFNLGFTPCYLDGQLILIVH